MRRSYENLVGALDRTIFFRPERRRVRELWSREAEPTLLVNGIRHALFDISMNGLSFIAGSGEWPTGQVVEVTLQLHDERVFAGPARIARSEPRHTELRVGLSFVGGFLDLADVHRRDEEARLTRELARSPAELWAAIPRPYTDALTAALHFLQHYRQVLDHHEARYRAGGFGGLAELESLTRRAAEALRGPWTELERAASRATRACLDHPGALRAAKTVTETLVTPLLLEAPMIRRAYHKPLGYPGDYQVMLYYYDNTFEGDSVFARVFHKFFVEHPLSNGVRTRKDLVVELMAAELRRHLASRARRRLEICSLGCGPGREVLEFAARHKPWDGDIRWTLVDQEEETLSVAYHAARRELSGGARGEVHCLNLSFAQLLNDPALMRSIVPQDFIYSTGLFDYLPERRAQGLIEALYDRLLPGGLLAIGNAIEPNEWLWSAEMVLDWTLLYRTREEMFRLAERIRPAKVDVVVEPGGAYYFLLIRKPAS